MKHWKPEVGHRIRLQNGFNTAPVTGTILALGQMGNDALVEFDHGVGAWLLFSEMKHQGRQPRPAWQEGGEAEPATT